jgi:hypothetical protein
VAHRRLMRSVEYRRSKYLNNRAENSHQPIRQRERAMKKFTSPGHAQRFLSALSGISRHFRPRRHRLTTIQYRHEMTSRFALDSHLERDRRPPHRRLTPGTAETIPRLSLVPLPVHQPGNSHAGFRSGALWVPNRSSTMLTCGITGQWLSGMIASRDGTTALSDLLTACGLVRIAGPEHTIDERGDPGAPT